MNPIRLAAVLVIVVLAVAAGYGLRAVTEGDDSTAPNAAVDGTATPSPHPRDTPESTPTSAATAAVTPENAATPAPIATDTPVPQATPLPPLEITVATLSEGDANYSIDVEYPQMGLPFDATIEQVVQNAAQTIRDLAKQSPPGSNGSAPYSLTGGIDSTYIGPDIISVRLTLSSYTGGAHGSSTIYGFNFDRSDGHELTLDDALQLTGLSLDETAEQAKDQLTSKLNDGIFADGALPTPENYSTFVLDADSVTFIFQEYQVAPYAAGPQEVSSPRVDGSR
jgi:hypothetical protein